MDSYEADEMFRVILGGGGALAVGIVVAIVLWLMGMKNIPMLAACVVVVAILFRYVIAPFLGFGF